MGTSIDAGTLKVLPFEILQLICSFTEGRDLAALKSTCSDFKKFVGGNQLLHRDIYLKTLDCPPGVEKLEDFDWEGGLQQKVKLELILRSRASVEEKLKHLPYVASTITTLLSNLTIPTATNSFTIEYLTSLFTPRSHNLSTFLCQSTLFTRTPFSTSPILASPLSPTTRQLSAKLHVLYGHPIEVPLRNKYQNAYPFACSVVYDLRRYTDDGTFWGPFLDNGKAETDWEKLEAVMIVIGRNLRDYFAERRWVGRGGVYGGNGWEAAVKGSQGYVIVDGVGKRRWKKPVVMKEVEEGATRVVEELKMPGDPYGVEGTWLRVVCFLDFEELYTYNFPHPHNHDPRPSPSSPDFQPHLPISTREAIRLIIMTLRVVKITPPGDEDGQDLPVVHFRGSSRSLHASWDPNARANIRGIVRLTKEGEVRWTSWSIYPGGEERWKSEGIQVGGPRSARGVLGHWFDKNMDPEGPAGPTYFYKISEDTSALTSSSSDLDEQNINDNFGFLDEDDEDDDESYGDSVGGLDGEGDVDEEEECEEPQVGVEDGEEVEMKGGEEGGEEEFMEVAQEQEQSLSLKGALLDSVINED